MTGNYYLYLFGQKITKLLPLRVAYAAACLLADFQCKFSLKDREAVTSNLTAVLQRPPTTHEIRDVFRNFAKYLVDFLTMTSRFKKDFISNHVTIKGMDHLNDVIKQGKGSIIVGAHLGNWEMGGAVLPQLGYPTSVVALPHADIRINNFFNLQREALGCMVIPTNVAIRRVVEHLRLNKLVGILAERDFGKHGIRMPFLNRTAMIPRGAAVFSLKTGAPIIPVFFLRQGEGSFVVTINEPIYPPKVLQGKINDEQLKEYINQYLRIIEQKIKEHPTQWLMFRDFTTS